jgi:hypothetical protein
MPKRLQGIITIRCITSQKSANLNNFPVRFAAWVRFYSAGPRQSSPYSDSVWTGLSEGRIPVRGEFFRTGPYRAWGRPSLLYNGYRFFPGGNAPGASTIPKLPIRAFATFSKVNFSSNLLLFLV